MNLSAETPMKIMRLSDILLTKGLITELDHRQALRMQEEVGGLIGQALIRLGALSEEDLLQALSKQLSLPIMMAEDISESPNDYNTARDRLGLSSKWLAARRCAIWCTDHEGPISVIAQDNLDPNLCETLEAQAFENNIELKNYIAGNQTLELAMRFTGPDETDRDGDGFTDDDTNRLREMAEEAPVIDFVNRVFSMALKENASDIHIEPFEHKFQVRYRIDGILHTRQTDSRTRFDAVASRVKLLSGMDIAERRLPQDGRQTIRFSGQEIDLRVSSLPGSWGESLVLRLLRKENELPDLQALGLEGHANDVLKDLLNHPNGVILVTGPTGSGKSTTLYRSLQGLNDGIHKIITIEDPVEYDMDGIIQIQTNANIGFTFAKGLRAILRQDPDIIMIGEIRDGETATISAQAALTGHLVLSTLHTNSSLAAVARLIDIGLEPFMVVSAVRGFAAQRLVRRLCSNCSVPVKNPEGEDKIWKMVENGRVIEAQLTGKPQWRAPKGCKLCSDTGYLGRIAIFEAAKVDEALSDAILKGVSLRQLEKTARNQGFITLLEDGILKARSGATTLSEVFRVCGADKELSGISDFNSTAQS